MPAISSKGHKYNNKLPETLNGLAALLLRNETGCPQNVLIRVQSDRKLGTSSLPPRTHLGSFKNISYLSPRSKLKRNYPHPVLAFQNKSKGQQDKENGTTGEDPEAPAFARENII